jgi:hypothetical protein
MTATRSLVGPALLAGLCLLLGSQGTLKAQEALVGEGARPGVHIEIRDLIRGAGGVVTLRLRIVNTSAEAFRGGCAMYDKSHKDECGTFSGVYLLDTPNRKKYLVVRDADGQCVCGVVDDIDAGKQMNLWATFPAPPPEVESVTVVVPLFEPVAGVPVTGG